MIRISERLKGGELGLLGQNTAEYTFSPLLVSFAESFGLLITETYNKGIS